MPALPYEKVSDCVEKVKARWDGIDLDGAHGRCRVIAYLLQGFGAPKAGALLDECNETMLHGVVVSQERRLRRVFEQVTGAN